MEYDDIRSDLWTKMTIDQLNDQHNKLLTRMSHVQQMMGGSASPTVVQMYGAMQHALSQLNNIMNTHRV